MFKKLAQWHTDWENEIIGVLANPALAARTAPGYRRCVANKLAEMSAIERMQMREFSIKYRGWRFYARAGVLMLILALAGGLLYLAFPGKAGLLESIVVVEVLGLSVATCLVSIWFNYRSLTQFKPKKLLIGAAMGGLGAMCGICAVLAFDEKPLLEVLVQLAPKMAMASLFVAGAMFLLIGTVALYRNRQYHVLATRLQHEAEREKLGRQLSESKLRLLRSQIEPHFLFNTLGAVQQLAEAGAPRAAELTANLIDFLRASMEEMRAEQVSLADEFKLVEAYLKVMQVRLGSRLRYTLQLPEALCGAQVPGMVVLTLVENAIKHGIEPALRGGEITVTALQGDGGIGITVHDSGAGLAGLPGQGFGLQNVRERLQLAYHGGASFALRDAPDGGAIAALHLPTFAPGPQ